MLLTVWVRLPCLTARMDIPSGSDQKGNEKDGKETYI